jgi:hypothetical protein
MFVLSQQDNAVYRVVATLLILALVMWTVSVHSTAEAANLTSVSNTLSDSDISAVSDHFIEFTVPANGTGIDQTGEQIVVSFVGGFDLTGVTVADIDLIVAAADQTLAASPSGTTWGVTVDAGADTITFEADSATIATSAVVQIEIGTNADSGTNQITNPGSQGSYEIQIQLPDDYGETEVAILDNVVVTASVDTNFEFTVNGFATAGIDINGTSTTGTSSATALPFGELTAGAVETLGQRLNVTTNAIGGFVVTVEQDQDLQSATGAVIDSFIEGAYTDTPASWQSPVVDIGDPTTWGHWGLTSSDDLNGTEFGTDLWVAASTTPREIFSHDGPSDGSTDNIGSTTVAYQVEITALQEAAEDYTTTLTYIATPTF